MPRGRTTRPVVMRPARQSQQGFYRPSPPAGGGPAASTADARGRLCSGHDAPLRRRDAERPVIRVPPRTAPRPMPAIRHRPAGTMHRSRHPARTSAPRNTVPPDAAVYQAPALDGWLPGRCPRHRLSVHSLQRRLSCCRHGCRSVREHRWRLRFATECPADLWRRTVSGRPVDLRRRVTDVWSRLAIRDLWHEHPAAGAHVWYRQHLRDALQSTTGTYGTSGGYRPGSTSRNNNLLNPSDPTQTATPTSGSTYPSTYNR